MALVSYKYMVDRIPEDELRRTFAAREHTLEYLVGELRKQIGKPNPPSFLIYGPRGAGKTTLVRMLDLRIRDEPELWKAYRTVRPLGEEMPHVGSLLDFLMAILREIAESGHEGAQAGLREIADVRDERRALQMAEAALREIAREERRRILIIAENLDLLIAGRAGSGPEKRDRQALRRLLLEDRTPILLVATAVSPLRELRTYEEALFGHFLPVPLEGVTDDELQKLLFRRAEFDRAPDFATTYRANAGAIATLNRMTGGNPRLALMLYELLAVGAVDSITRTLNEMLDGLTPLYKDLLEHRMTRQQAKIVDALMRAGGTAQPRDLTRPTRLGLNAVNSHLTRLKEMQHVEKRGGGKGRPAFYSIADRVFVAWYQLRYLRAGRRVELFTEFLRVWLDETLRLKLLRKAASDETKEDAVRLTEYLAASLKGTPYEKEAFFQAIEQRTRLGRDEEAALLLAELQDRSAARAGAAEYLKLADLALSRDDLPTAHRNAKRAVEANPGAKDAWGVYGIVLGIGGDHKGALDAFNRQLSCDGLTLQERAKALFNRGVAKGLTGDTAGARADWLRVVATAEAEWALRLDAAADALTLTTSEPALEEVLNSVTSLVSSAPEKDRADLSIQLLARIQRPALRDRWPRVYRRLRAVLSGEAAEKLSPLVALCEILETGDMSKLDPLPPNERDFVQEALAAFAEKKSATPERAAG